MRLSETSPSPSTRLRMTDVFSAEELLADLPAVAGRRGHVDGSIAFFIEIPDEPRARPPSHACDRIAVAAHLQRMLLGRDARFVIDDQLASFFAHEAIDAEVAVTDLERQLAADRLRFCDAFEGRRAGDRAQARLHACDDFR